MNIMSPEYGSEDGPTAQTTQTGSTVWSVNLLADVADAYQTIPVNASANYHGDELGEFLRRSRRSFR